MEKTKYILIAIGLLSLVVLSGCSTKISCKAIYQDGKQISQVGCDSQTHDCRISSSTSADLIHSTTPVEIVGKCGKIGSGTPYLYG